MLTIIREISTRRNLIYELVVKDLKVRYHRPVLGSLWAFLSPLCTVGIFYLVFSVILRVKIKEAPFILYLMSAVFPWRFFQDSLLASVGSLIDNKNLIRESNFPHYFIPLSIVLANAVNFLPSLGVLIIAAVVCLKGLPVFIIFLPVILLMHLILAVGLSLIVSLLYVNWRDTKYILDVLLQILFYLTPAFYSIYLIRDSFGQLWFNIYSLNPFVGILNLYRLTILKGYYPVIKAVGPASIFFIPLGFAVAVLLASFYFYKRNKITINDYLSY